MEEDNELSSGRYVHSEFRLTDPLVKFVNDDVLPRINTDAKFVRAYKIDEHTLFLVHNQAAEDNPHEAIMPFINTFKSLLGLLEYDDPDEFDVVRFGVASEGYHLPAAASPDPFAHVRAVSSQVSAFGGADAS